MDDEIEVVLNVTEIEQIYEPSLNSVIHTWVVIIASVMALLSDILIVTTILGLRRLQNRRNFILLHWAAIDIALLSSTPKLSRPVLFFLTNIKMHAFASCTISLIDAISVFAELLIVITFLSNRLMESKSITVDTILKVVYSIVVVILIICTGVCAASIMEYFPLHFIILFMFGFILLQVIVKDIHKFCKRKTSPLSPAAMIRLNIGRIYSYNVLLAIGLIIFTNARFIPLALRAVTEYCAVTGVLGSFYITMYLFKIDEHFRNGVIGLFRRNTNNVDEANEALEEITLDGSEVNK